MKFSKATLDFIDKASRQKRPDWLDRNREEYERVLLEPLKNLARHLKARLSSEAPGYNFPQKGFARLKRSENRAKEYGALYRDWVSYSAARPRKSRFETNPNLFFLLQPGEEVGDEILLAGGLYMPSSRQTRAIREAIAENASAFDELFASKAFSSRFPGGFCPEKKSSRPTRGYDPAHPRMEWLKLQAFFVWRSYTKREFASKEFPEIIARDCEQILRLNRLLDLAIENRLPRVADPRAKKEGKRAGLRTSLDVLETIEAPRRKMDF